MMETTPMIGRVIRAMRGRGLWRDASSFETSARLATSAPIFIYHAVAEDEARRAVDPYVLSESLFRAQVRGIVSSRVPVTRLLEMDFAGLAITFDDGCMSWLRRIAPILAEHDLPATFFVIAGRTHGERGSTALNEPLTWNAIRELAGIRGRDGKPLFEIGSHGLRHENLAERLTATGPVMLRDELRQSRDIISQQTGLPCRLLSIPGGKTGRDNAAQRLLRQIAGEAGFGRVRDSLPRYDRCPVSDFLGGSPVYSHTSAAMVQFEIARLRRGNARNAATWLLMRSTGRWVESRESIVERRTSNIKSASHEMPRPAASRSNHIGSSLTWHLPRLASSGCGMSRRVRDLAAGLLRGGHDVRLIVPAHATDVMADHIDGVPLYRHELVGKPSLHWSLQARARSRAAMQLASALNNPGDAVLTCQPEFAAAARARHPDLPIVLVACCSQLLYEAEDRRQAATSGASHRAARAVNRTLLRRAERRGFLAASAIAFDSEMTRDAVVTAYDLMAERCSVIHPTVDTKRFRPPTSAMRVRLRRSLSLPRNGIVACWSGRMEDRKNVEMLIDAVSRVRDNIAALLLVGDGSDRQRLESYSHQLGLDGIVRFSGLQTDVTPYLQASDLFILPSLVESFGIALVEAMACGLPCIALGRGPIVRSNADWLIEHGRTGLIVDTPNGEHLAEAIHRIASDETLRVNMGVAGRHCVELNHEAGRDVAQLEALLEKFVR